MPVPTTDRLIHLQSSAHDAATLLAAAIQGGMPFDMALARFPEVHMALMANVSQHAERIVDQVPLASVTPSVQYALPPGQQTQYAPVEMQPQGQMAAQQGPYYGQQQQPMPIQPQGYQTPPFQAAGHQGPPQAPEAATYAPQQPVVYAPQPVYVGQPQQQQPQSQPQLQPQQPAMDPYVQRYGMGMAPMVQGPAVTPGLAPVAESPQQVHVEQCPKGRTDCYVTQDQADLSLIKRGRAMCVDCYRETA